MFALPRATRVSVIVALLTSASACGATGPSDPEAAPTLTGKTLEGEYWSSLDARGKVVLVNVWATWCGPCRNELPVLESLHEAYVGREFELVGVSVDSDADARKVQAMALQAGLSYRVVLDPRKRVTADWHITGYPTSVLLDRKGRPTWRSQGEIPREHAQLDDAIEAALAGESSTPAR